MAGINNSSQKLTLKSGPTQKQIQSENVVAFCGTRGLPANYGGFETAVDEITQRFLKAGYQCDVFCRRSSYDDAPATDQGRKLIYIDGSKKRTLDTFVSSIQTAKELWRNRKRYKHVFWFNNANLPGILMTALMGIPMSVNTDGLEWRRAKWSWPFKIYYILSSFLICRICRSLVSDSVAIQKFYRVRFWKKTHLIPYGIPTPIKVTADEQARILTEYGLEREKYFLQITRIEPDNYPLEIASAFIEAELAKQGFKHIVVGYKDDTDYALRLRKLDGEAGVSVERSVYDPKVVQTLRENCFCYVHGNSVGGTNPALLEAMATCPRVLAIDSEFSSEVLGGRGLVFDHRAIAVDLVRAAGSETEAEKLKESVNRRYQWDAVSESYIRLAEKQPADYRPTVARRQVLEAIENESKASSETE